MKGCSFRLLLNSFSEGICSSCKNEGCGFFCGSSARREGGFGAGRVLGCGGGGSRAETGKTQHHQEGKETELNPKLALKHVLNIEALGNPGRHRGWVRRSSLGCRQICGRFGPSLVGSGHPPVPSRFVES